MDLLDFEYFCRVKRCLHIVSFLVGLAMLVACSQPTKVEVPEPAVPEAPRRVEGPTIALSQIDTLMWHHPDSALAVMMEFAGSEAADGMDVFEGHYCQLLISELLYKNYYEQSNREDLLKAVDYFDSLTSGMDGVDTRGVFLRREYGTAVKERNVFLDARAHYINGAGCYEEGNVVRTCEEYLMALELMESSFMEEDLIGFKAQFMALTYNRLGDLFSEQFMMESAVDCYECALAYCRIESTSPQGVPSIIYRIGQQYNMMGEKEKGREYYEKALEEISDDDNLCYRDLASIIALCDYQLDSNATLFFNNMKQILSQVEDEKERLSRFLTVGAVFFEEKLYDSAMFYFVPVFSNNDIDEASRIQAAEYLLVIYDRLGDKEKSDECVRFLVDHKKPEGEDKALVSKLEDQFKDYLNQKQKKEAEAERKRSIERTVKIIVPIAIAVALVILVVAKLRGWKMLKQQQDEAERVLKVKELQHKQELEAKQDEALQQMEAARQSHEEEVKRLRATVEQSSQHQREVLQQLVLAIYQTGGENRLQRILDEFESAFPSATVRLEQTCPNLNETERRIVILSFLGFRAKEVADLLSLKENTVRQYRSNLKKKADIDGLSTSIG